MTRKLTISASTTIFAVILGLAISVMAEPPILSPASVESEYKRLKALAVRLEKIPMLRQDREPHKSFLRRNKRDIVYSDPSGQWYVRAERFWELARRNRQLPIADDIAWTAANTPLPGECEGDMNCSLYYTQQTAVEYLKIFPAGKHRKKALSDLVHSVSALTAPDAGAGYSLPTDAEQKTEMRKLIANFRKTLAKVSDRGKEKALAELNKLAETYK